MNLNVEPYPMAVAAIFAVLIWNLREVVKEQAAKIATRILMLACRIYFDQTLRADRSAQMLRDLEDISGPLTKLNIAILWILFDIVPSAIHSNIRFVVNRMRTHWVATIAALLILTVALILLD